MQEYMGPFAPTQTDQFYETAAEWSPVPMNEVTNSWTDLGVVPSSDTVIDPRRPRTVVGKAFDIISRPLYTVTEFADAILDNNHDSPTQALWGAAKRAVHALFTGGQRLTWSDLLRQEAPELTRDHAVFTGIAGFALDVLTDPLSWIGIGPTYRAVTRVGKGFTLAKSKKLDNVLQEARTYAVNNHLATDDAFALDKVSEAIGELVDIQRSRGVSTTKGMRDIVNSRATRNADFALSISKGEKTSLKARFQHGDIQDLRRIGFSSVTDDISAVPSPWLSQTQEQVMARLKAQNSILSKGAKGRESQLLKDMTARYGTELEGWQKANLSLRKENTAKAIKEMNLPEDGVFNSVKHNVDGNDYVDYFVGNKTGEAKVRAGMRFKVDADGKFSLVGMTGGMKDTRKLMDAAFGDLGDNFWRAFDETSNLSKTQAKNLHEALVATAVEHNSPVHPLALREFWSRGKKGGGVGKSRAVAVAKERNLERSMHMHELQDHILDKLDEWNWTPEEVFKGKQWGLGVGQARVPLENLARYTGLYTAGEAVASLPGVRSLGKMMGDSSEFVKNALSNTVGAKFSKKQAVMIEGSRLSKAGLDKQGRARFYRDYQQKTGLMEAQMLQSKQVVSTEMANLAKTAKELGITTDQQLGRLNRIAADIDLHLKTLATAKQIDPQALTQADLGLAITTVGKRHDLVGAEHDFLVNMYSIMEKHRALTAEGHMAKLAVRAESIIPGFWSEPKKWLKAKWALMRDIGQANKPRTQDKVQALITAKGGKDWLKGIEDVEKLEKTLGINIEGNVLAAFGSRLLGAKRKSAQQSLSSWLRVTTGSLSPDDIAKKAPTIHADLQNYGLFHSPFEREEQMTAALRMYDRMLGSFKKAAVIGNPAFSFRQLIGNGIQVAAAKGARMDAAATSAAFSTVMFGGRIDDFTYMTPFAKIGGKELKTLLSKYPVLRNASLATDGTGQLVTQWGGGRFIEGQASELARANRLSKGGTMVNRFIKNPALQYTAYPARVEDSMRLSVFVSGLGKGYTPQQAMELVDKALFNYTTGLTQLEQNLMRRIVPFYTFQRFGAQLAVEALGANPAAPLTMKKAWDNLTQTIEKWDQGQTLTDTERKVIPGFMLEQPTLFRGWTDDMRAKFWAFTGFSFFESLNLASFDEKGELDFAKSLRQGFVAQLNPLLKVGLEFAAERNMFTGQQLLLSGHPADKKLIGEINPRAFKSAFNREVASMMTGGNVAVAAGAEFAGWLTNMSGGLDGFAEALLGWEEAVDPQTGKTVVYVSPARAAFFRAIMPGLNRILTQSRADRTGADIVLQRAFGVRTQDTDLAGAYMNQARRAKADVTEAQNDITSLYAEQRLSSIGRAQQELNDAMRMVLEIGQLGATAASIRGQNTGTVTPLSELSPR